MKIPGKYEKVIRKMAKHLFPSDAERILEKCQKQYEVFWRETPDIGGKENMQYKDLDFLIAFFAFYEACDRRIAFKEFDEYAYETMVKSSEKAGRFMSWNSPLMYKMADKMYGNYKKKIDEHVAKGEWGNTWRIELNPEQHKEGFAIHTRMCPNVDFCRKHGYEAFLPKICKQDHRIAKAMHGVLIRTHTVADGDDYCDWWYFGDRMQLPEEAKKRLKEMK